jgi:hypothetical protein
MAYTAGDTILDDEYNTFVNNATSPYGYNHFAGTGAGAYGLGQSAISTVAAGNTITAAQWNSLWTGMDNIANHVNIALTSTAAVSSGNTIAIKAALATDLASLAAQVALGSPSATALTDTATVNDDTANNWTTSQTVTVTITAASQDALRYFFNAGGKIVVDWSNPTLPTGSTNAKNTEWIDICGRAGPITIKAHDLDNGGSGTINNDFGYYDLTGSYQTLMTTVGNDGTYGAAQTLVMSALTSTNTITIRTVFTDGAADTTYHSSAITDDDYVGVLRMATFAKNPNTTQGLATAYTVSVS